MPAKARDHLVEDEEGAVGVAELPQAVEEAGRAARSIRLGLEDDAGDLPGVLPEERLGAREVVVAEAHASGVARPPGSRRACAVVPMNQSSVEKKGWSRQTRDEVAPVSRPARASRRPS